MHGKLIGLGCRAQVGKDTAAAGLDAHRLAFADNVRALAKRIDPYVNDFGLRLSDAVERLGWDGAKTEILEVRRLLQELGGGTRELIGPRVFVQPVLSHARDLLLIGQNVVITDVRFPNEADAIRQEGGMLIRIDRSDVPRIDHPTENALDDYEFDHVVDNSGSKTELCAAVRAVVGDGS